MCMLELLWPFWAWMLMITLLALPFFLNKVRVYNSVNLQECEWKIGVALFLRVFLPFFSAFLYLLLLLFCLHYVLNTECSVYWNESSVYLPFLSLSVSPSSSLPFLPDLLPIFFCGEDFQAVLKYFNVFL